MIRIGGRALASILLGVSVAVAAILISSAPEPARVEPPSQTPFVRTASVSARSGTLPVFGSGTVRPSEEIDIVSQVGGRIVSVHPGFRSGGRVRAGQTLFQVEDVDYRYQVGAAEADLAARRLALSEEQERAAIALTQYESYANRQLGADSVPKPSSLTLREPQLRAAHVAVARDELRLAAANMLLTSTRVTAPFNASVREESVAVGQLVAAGQAVGRLFATDAAEVVVPLSDSDAALLPELWDLAPGDGDTRVPARIVSRHGDRSHEWQGFVDRAETSLDEHTRTIDVVVRVPDPFSAPADGDDGGVLGSAPPLLIGSFVEVEIEGLELDRYFTIPLAALQPGNEVWAVLEGGIVDIVSVEVVQRAENDVFVTGDLTDGQLVIVGGISFATEGMQVLTSAEPPP